VESVLSTLVFIGFVYLMMRYGCGAHMHAGGCGHSSHTLKTKEDPNREDRETRHIA
jgi:hypothetical protein